MKSFMKTQTIEKLGIFNNYFHMELLCN